MTKTSGAKAAKAKAASKKSTAVKTRAPSAAAKTKASAKSAQRKPEKPAPKAPAAAKVVPAAAKVVSKPPVKAAPARSIAAKGTTPQKKAEGPKSKMAPRIKISDIVLPAGYRPSEAEPFMNDMHRAYFRKRLIEWKDEILRQTRETLAILHEDSTQHADLADRATSETDRATELRTRDRQRKLISKIDAALGRIEDGSYGYCEDTGEPIGLKRLDARPIATLSVEAQERHERRERVYREE